MVSKAEERKALEQIKKIVESLGEGSYVATAFEGCFEDAEENIENDFALSMKSRWDGAQSQLVIQCQRLDEMKTENDNLRSIAKGFSDENEKLKDKFVEQVEKYGEAVDRFKEECEKVSRLAKECNLIKDDLNKKDHLILTLKARLYDYMTNEQQYMTNEREGEQ